MFSANEIRKLRLRLGRKKAAQKRAAIRLYKRGHSARQPGSRAARLTRILSSLAMTMTIAGYDHNDGFHIPAQHLTKLTGCLRLRLRLSLSVSVSTLDSTLFYSRLTT